MPFDRTELPARKHPAHMPVVYRNNRSIIVFVTVCTKNRKPILASHESMSRVIKAWNASTFWLVGRFVIMPEHIHLFCNPNRMPEYPIKRWVEFWRSQVSRDWHCPSNLPLWQKDCWDTQLRSGDSYSEKWAYVRNNPARHELIEKPEHWPFQGELNALFWHE